MEATSKESALQSSLPEDHVTKRILMDPLIETPLLALDEQFIECRLPDFLPIPAGRLA
jgi:hypothetical protein